MRAPAYGLLRFAPSESCSLSDWRVIFRFPQAFVPRRAARVCRYVQVGEKIRSVLGDALALKARARSHATSHAGGAHPPKHTPHQQHRGGALSPSSARISSC